MLNLPTNLLTLQQSKPTWVLVARVFRAAVNDNKTSIGVVRISLQLSTTDGG